MYRDHHAQIRDDVLSELETVHARCGDYPSTEQIGQEIYDTRTVEKALLQLELMGVVERHGLFAESHYPMVVTISR